MRIYKKPVGLLKSSSAFLSVLFLIIVSPLVIASATPQRKVPPSIPSDPSSDSVLPVANYDAPEAVDPLEKAKRDTRSKRFDGQSSEVIKQTAYPFERIWSSHWSRGLSSMPVLQCDAIVIGEVVDAHAYLSNDKTGVYSEFGIRLEDILKDSDGKLAISLANKQLISADRFGGAVRFPSGVVQKYRTQFQGMPRPGRRYVLLLVKVDQDQEFSLLTGYELRGQKVIPLDSGSNEGSERLPFESYRGTDAASFLRLVRDSIK